MSLIVDIKKRLGDFSLNVGFEAGGVVGLLGESGAGKSVALKCIAGIMRPDEGHIELNGRVLFDSKRRISLAPQARRVGLLLQGGGLFPNMTVEKNILAGRRGMDRAKALDKARALMLRFGLSMHAGQYPAELSGGQAQRCALARILMGEPDALLLDEPLTALDDSMSWQLEQALAETFEAFSGPVIYVTHDRSEAYRLCSGICVVSSGLARGVHDKRTLFDSPADRASALLTGCKNVSRAERTGADTLLASDWGVELRCAAPVPDNTCYVGIRAQYVQLSDGGQNTLPCTVLRLTEDVFRTIATLITPAGAPLYAYVENGLRPEPGALVAAYIPPERVMPLTDAQ